MFKRLAFSVCWISLAVVSAALLADEPLHVRIDALIQSQFKGPVSDLCDDATFMRRASLDFVGSIPNVSELRAFMASEEVDKREKLIDRLLDDERHPRHLANQFNIMLMERRGEHEQWLQFLTDAVAKNKPWDQIVREILAPDPSDEQSRGSAFFYTKRLERYGQNPDDMPGLVRDVGRMFLGIDVQCAQCHDHLFVDDYKQADWQGLFAFVGSTGIDTAKEFPAITEKPLLKKIEFASVFDAQPMSVGPRLPGLTEFAIPEFAKGEEYAVPPDRKTKEPGVPKFSTTKLLSQQLPSRELPAFSRNAVNRIWWMMMGRGLVEPLDMHHSDNPPSHPELLDLLGEAFVEHQYDIRWLVRQLALTRTYARSSVTTGASGDSASYQCATERRLSAEQLFDSILQATGATLTVDQRDDALKRFRDAFANPPKEPELEVNPTVKGALFLLNDDQIQRFLREGDLLHRVQEMSEARQQVEEIYLATLSRMPSDEELRLALEFIPVDKSNVAGNDPLHHLAWALLASTEFFVNH
ncbi:MAG: DUF1553 domain-containing protein [Pirellulaceae bacterium]